MTVIQTALDLISFKSVSGEKDEGALNYIQNFPTPIGFKVRRDVFEGDGSYKVDNLYAEYTGGKGKNLCFAGHTDVVPAGDLAQWNVNPFKPEIKDGYLIGRGAVDMKGSIACFMVAAKEFISKNPKFNGKISFLITGDEEADSINGTEKQLKKLTAEGIKIDSCIIGEPTNPSEIGEMIKVGRRGSVSFQITIHGMQGHVAYPEKALNPNPLLISALSKISNLKLDVGNEFFQPSNLEVTTIDVGNPTANIIPAKASATMNIRFNNLQTSEGLKKIIEDILKEELKNYPLARYEISQKGRVNQAFLCNPDKLANVLRDAAKKVTGKVAEFSTTGGTSDARFIKDYAEVAEFGLINQTAHKIDEKIKTSELEQLKDIYFEALKGFFN